MLVAGEPRQAILRGTELKKGRMLRVLQPLSGDGFALQTPGQTKKM
jgi:hypothetical protein